MRMVVLLMSLSALAAGCADQRAGTSRATPSPMTNTVQRAEAVQPQPSREVREAQQQLRELGLYAGSVDGLWGPETQIAVERFQRDRGLVATARLDDATESALRASLAPVTLHDPTDVRALQNRLAQLNFFQGRANGVWGPETQVAVENFQRARGLPVGQLNQATVAALGFNSASFPSRPSAGPVVGGAVAPGDLDRTAVRSVQQRLRHFGFYRMSADGVWGPASRSALQEFQQSRGIEASGLLTPVTVSALGLDPNQLGSRTSLR